MNNCPAPFEEKRVPRQRSTFVSKLAGWTSMALLAHGCMSAVAQNDRVIFSDDFEDGISTAWDVSDVPTSDFRVRNGGLEVRVQPGKLTEKTPVIRVMVPALNDATFTASVELTLDQPFTEPAEMAGLYLISDEGLEFGVKKQWIDGQLLYSPGQPEYLEEPGGEGSAEHYALRYWPAVDNAGPMRIIVRNDYAYFQVGPDDKGKYLNPFHSAIAEQPKQRGFALFACGGPEDAEHWVRFDNFRVAR